MGFMNQKKWVFHRMPRYQMRRNAINKLLKALGILKGKKLLEMGYGAGDIFSLYENFGLNCFGYDFSEEALITAKSNKKNADVHFILNEKEIEANAPFDLVCAFEVLEHIKDDVDALKSWASYLQKDGYLMLAFPAHMKRWGACDVLSGHFRRYEKKEVEEKLKAAGFVAERIWTYDYPYCFFLDKMRDKDSERKMKEEGITSDTDKKELTKESGLRRDFSKKVIFLSNPLLWKLPIKIGELFYKTDKGSAYVVLARKL